MTENTTTSPERGTSPCVSDFDLALVEAQKDYIRSSECVVHVCLTEDMKALSSEFPEMIEAMKDHADELEYDVF